MSIVYCTHCGVAYLIPAEQCPHCNTFSPSRASLSGKGILTAMLLGITITGCQNEEDIMDDIAISIEEKSIVEGDTEEAKNPELSISDSPSTSVKEQSLETNKTDSSLADGKDNATKEVAASKKDEPTDGIGSGTYGLNRPEMPISSKYGVPAPPREPSTARVSMQKIELMGEGCSTGINKNIRRYLAHVKSVYQRELQINPELSGRVNFEIVIEDGRVMTTKVLANTTGNPELAGKIENKMKRWRFAADCSTTAVVPLLLRSK